MITNKEDFILQNNFFKKIKNSLYEDIITSDLASFKINDFQKFNSNTSLYKVETSFKDYYFLDNDNIPFKDILFNKQTNSNIDYLSTADKLLINTRDHSFVKNTIKFVDKLYLNNYDYSTSFTEIIAKYKLPKHFLIKALSTGCPDDEFPEAAKWNKTLQKILDNNSLTIEEFKDKIITDYTNKPEKRYLNLNYKILDLVYLSIVGDFELLSHTTLKLKIKDKEVFENIIKLFIDLNINKTIYNDIYNKEEYSIIIINSSLIYNLFKSNFDNYNFILNLSQLFTNHLFKRLNDYISIKINNLEALNYVQEFFFRYKLIYKREVFNGDLYLIKNNDFIINDNKIELSIYEIKKEENPFSYLGVI